MDKNYGDLYQEILARLLTVSGVQNTDIALCVEAMLFSDIGKSVALNITSHIEESTRDLLKS